MIRLSTCHRRLAPTADQQTLQEVLVRPVALLLERRHALSAVAEDLEQHRAAAQRDGVACVREGEESDLSGRDSAGSSGRPCGTPSSAPTCPRCPGRSLRATSLASPLRMRSVVTLSEYSGSAAMSCRYSMASSRDVTAGEVDTSPTFLRLALHRRRCRQCGWSHASDGCYETRRGIRWG